MGERDAWPRANLEETGGRFAVGEKFYRRWTPGVYYFDRGVAKHFFCQPRFAPSPPFSRAFSFMKRFEGDVDRFYAQNFDGEEIRSNRCSRSRFFVSKDCTSISEAHNDINNNNNNNPWCAGWGGRGGAGASVRRDVEKGGRGRLGPLDSDYGWGVKVVRGRREVPFLLLMNRNNWPSLCRHACCVFCNDRARIGNFLWRKVRDVMGIEEKKKKRKKSRRD